MSSRFDKLVSLLRLARGEREILEGKGHGLREVMKEAERILKGE